MPRELAAQIASEMRLRAQKVEGTLALLDKGYEGVFIAHYRKEATGAQTVDRLRTIAHRYRELAALEKRRAEVLESIRSQGELSRELEQAINEAKDVRTVEELYTPYSRQRRTAAQVAVERGLEPLSRAILAGLRGDASLEALAAGYVNHEKEIHAAEDALAGASHIIAENYSVQPSLREKVRAMVWDEGILRCERGVVPEDQVREFQDYFKFVEAVKDLPPHRVLAVNRGERRKALKVSVTLPEGRLLSACTPMVVSNDHPRREFLVKCLADAIERIMLPAARREIRHELTERAERHAVDVFCSNLRGILMTPPVSGRCVLAVDPGFRTGCKVAAISPEGVLLGETIIYPHEPQRRWAEAKAALVKAIDDYKVNLVAIGNGTGSHETEKLLTEIIASDKPDLRYALVSEAGTTAYSASDIAKEEFENLDAAVRGTISIGRRLQDPLSEFVKVDARCIGVGLYQHDVDQNLLKERLDEVVEECVNEVGVNVNTAHRCLLERVAGVGPEAARAIVAWRKEHGALRTREQLKEIPGIDERRFEQAAGFLRIVGGDEPLDRTGIHPESYAVARRLISRFGYEAADLAKPGGLPGLRGKLEHTALDKLAGEMGIGIPTLSSILHWLEFPDYDVRQENEPPLLKKEMMQFENLAPGMWLRGSIRNVVDFGAFVDIGLKEDGLIHISQFSKKFVKNATDFVHVSQIVNVRVIAIDKDRRRIALSLIREAAETPKAAEAERAQGEEKQAGGEEAPAEEA